MRFVLTIELGNDAMQDAGDIASVLRKTAKLICPPGGAFDEPKAGDAGPIHDENGNRVGGWHVE